MMQKEYSMRMIKDNLGGICEEAVAAHFNILRQYLGIYLEGLKLNIKFLSHDKWYQSDRLLLNLLAQRPVILTGFSSFSWSIQFNAETVP
jgi:hypothetical protein